MLTVLNRTVARIALTVFVTLFTLGLPVDAIIMSAECAAAGAGNCP